MSSNKLPIHEWSIIVLFCAILLVLSVLALRNTIDDHQAAPIIKEETPITVLQVFIEGCVANPGKYYLPSGSSLHDLLAQAILLPEADQSHLKPQKKLRQGQRITVPKQGWMTVHIAGAAKNTGPMKILSGMRCRELAPRIDFTPDADIKGFLKQTRYLKEGDIIVVKFKETRKKFINDSPKKRGKKMRKKGDD